MRELVTTSVVLTEESIGKYYKNSYGDILKITKCRLGITRAMMGSATMRTALPGVWVFRYVPF